MTKKKQPTNSDSPRNSNTPAAGKALLFILPSVIVTGVSMALFTQLQNFTAEQLNYFTVTILLAIVVSLLSTSGAQTVIYQLTQEGKDLQPAAARGIRMGIRHGAGLAVVLGLLFLPYFLFVLHFPVINFVYFFLLVLIQSVVWIIMAAFWATEQYFYPAIIFSFSYLSIFCLTYGIHILNADYTLAAYAAGSGLMLVLALVAAKRVFLPGSQPKQNTGLAAYLELLSRRPSATFFQLFYMLAIFLDKIIVWVWQGIDSGAGLTVTGPYTVAAFMGLIPTFSIAAVAYFNDRARLLVQDMYQGSIFSIQDRAAKYKSRYLKSLGIILTSAIMLFITAAFIINRLAFSSDTGAIFITIGAGAIFFSLIVYNSAILPLFGQTRISMLCMLTVCLGEMASIPFLSLDIWYAAVGFAAGSFTAWLISQITIIRLFSAFEYNLFRYATVNVFKSEMEGKKK